MNMHFVPDAAARVALDLACLDHSTARVKYGVDYVGAVVTIVQSDGALAHVTQDVRLILRDAAVVGFSTEATGSVNYADAAAMGRVTGALALHGPSMSLALNSKGVAEEALAQAIRANVSSQFVLWLAKTINADFSTKQGKGRVSAKVLTFATRLANAIVSEAIRNAIPPARAGALHLVRRFPVGLRKGLSRPLFTQDAQEPRKTDWRRDLLCQAPVLALQPFALWHGAGRSPDEVLKSAGLHTGFKALKASALGPLARYRRDQNFDFDLMAVFPWLTAGVCCSIAALNGAQQSLTLEFGIALSPTLPVDEVEARLVWFASVASAMRQVSKHRTDILLAVRDWMTLDPETLEAVGSEPWRPDIALEAARRSWERIGASTPEMLANALHRHQQRKEQARVPFEPPVWTPPDGQLPGRNGGYVALGRPSN